MNTQSSIQEDGCHSRWHCVPSASPIFPGKCFEDTTCIRIPCVLSPLPLFMTVQMIGMLFVLVFKRGKATPNMGAFHTSDIPEFYGTDAKPDFIGTDALGIFSSPVTAYVFLTLLLTTQSTLPILVTPQFPTTLTASSPLWIGNHGVRRLIIHYWPSWTLLRMLVSHSTTSE